jgi:hypothetical protein
LENQTEQVFQCLSVVVTEDFKTQNSTHDLARRIRSPEREYYLQADAKW